VGHTLGLFGVSAQVNTVSAEKLHVRTALDISNIRPLEVNDVHSSSRLVSKAVINVMWLSGKPHDNKGIVN
jgi:hypothetical protein